MVQAQGQHFVCYVSAVVPPEQGKPTMLQVLRDRLRRGPEEALLVSSPGYAALDSGCGRSIVGEETLAQFRRLWTKAGIDQPRPSAERNTFRFGNGHEEVTNKVVEMPIMVAGRRGAVRAAVIKGQAPLLLSRAALKRLKAQMDFDADELMIFESKTPVRMMTNEAGQYMIPVANFENASDPQPRESCSHCLSAEVRSFEGSDEWSLEGDKLIRYHRTRRSCPFFPDESDCPVPLKQLADSCTVVKVNERGLESSSQAEWKVPKVLEEPAWVGRTVFQVLPPPTPAIPENEIALSEWSKRQRRQVKSQARRLPEISTSSQAKPSNTDIVEIFSPPQFAKLAGTISADLATGWDFRLPDHRESIKELVRQSRPRLLIIGSPCSWNGGWFHLNKPYMDQGELNEKSRLTRMFLNFAAELVQMQLDLGGQAILECPSGPHAWSLPRLNVLRRAMHEITVDMCCFGLAAPGELPIHKRTRLLVSHANMRSLQRQCQGEHQHQHKVSTGTRSGTVNRFIKQYPPAFMRAVLRTLPGRRDSAACLVQAGTDIECLAAARVQQLNAEKRDEMLQSLKRLHVNLGHPSAANLMRVLKHGGASKEAVELAKELECDVCKAQAAPKSPPPAQTNRATQFNQRIGIDVKYLPGWKPNQKVPAVNIVDFASSFQIVVPLHGRETSETIRKALLERWVSWAGTPQEIALDPAQTNLSDALTVPQELAGSKICMTAAEAHWQLGKVEVHGGWFSRILQKTIVETMPHDRETWEGCVYASHCKNELIQVYGMTPAQFVFGR